MISERLSAIISDLEQEIARVGQATYPALLGELERVKALLWDKLMHGHQVPQPTTNEKDLLTIPEVAPRLKLSVYRTYELARQGKLRTVKIGKSVRVPPAAVSEFLTRLNGGKAA